MSINVHIGPPVAIATVCATQCCSDSRPSARGGKTDSARWPAPHSCSVAKLSTIGSSSQPGGVASPVFPDTRLRIATARVFDAQSRQNHANGLGFVGFPLLD